MFCVYKRKMFEECLSEHYIYMYYIYFTSIIVFFLCSYTFNFGNLKKKSHFEFSYLQIPFPEYDPVIYEAPEVKEHPYWADTIDLIFMYVWCIHIFIKF